MANAARSESRSLELNSVPNARHLGGLLTGRGVTGLHDVVRSGTVSRLTPQDTDDLLTRGVRTVVDLRTAEERAHAPEPDLNRLGVRSVWAPLVARDPCPLGVNLEYGHAGFVWMYQNFLEYGRAAIVRLLQELAESAGGVLYHCTAGEDRTGLVTAVLLSLAGVSDETIVDDHALSLSTEKLALRGYDGPAAIQRMGAPLRGMEDLLELIRLRWGGVEGYLLDAGATAPVIQSFRARAEG